jgi:hypothetical protein
MTLGKNTLCIECHFAVCRYAVCHYGECRYAECHYAQCRGACGATTFTITRAYL